MSRQWQQVVTRFIVWAFLPKCFSLGAPIGPKDCTSLFYYSLLSLFDSCFHIYYSHHRKKMVRRRKETSRTAPWMILPIIMFIATCLAASLVWLSPGDRDLQLLQSTAPRDIAQWFRCGEDGGEHALQCFVRAIQESRPLLEAYNNVAASLRQGQRTPVGLSSVDCRAHAVTLMTHVQKAWHSVGRSLPASSPRVTIDQMEYSQSDCYLSYLRLEPEISKAWLMLGKDLPHGETKVQRLGAKKPRGCRG